MNTINFNTADRDRADQVLQKTLIIALCSSSILHGAVLASANYWSFQNSEEPLEITEIQRVELDPEPKPQPSIAPPKPKPVVKPPQVAKIPELPKPKPTPIAIPTPAEVKITTKPPQLEQPKISQPKPLPIPEVPPPVIKPFAPIAPPVVRSQPPQPAPKPIKSTPIVQPKITPATTQTALTTPPRKVIQPKLNPNPPIESSPTEEEFKLPTPQRLATNSSESKPSIDNNQTAIAPNRTTRKFTPQESTPDREVSPPPEEEFKLPTPQRLASNSSESKPSIDNNQTAIAPNRTTRKFTPQESTPDREVSPPPEEEFKLPIPQRLASNSSESKPSIDNNQTAIAPNRTTRKFTPQESTPDREVSPSDDDFVTNIPGNNQRIATSKIQPANPDRQSNQTVLNSKANRQNRLNNNFGENNSENNPNIDDNFGASIPGNNQRIATSNPKLSQPANNSTSGALGTNSQRRKSALGSTFNSNNSNVEPSGDREESIGGVPGNMAKANNSPLSIQCLRNCEIRYPDDLESADTGKDKILVQVSIDARGKVTNARIARSSGNQNLDRVTLDGIKKMELTAMGKPLTVKVKVSTLVNY